jgi:hypothetical protein
MGKRRVLTLAATALFVLPSGAALARPAKRSGRSHRAIVHGIFGFEVRSIDGRANNLAHPRWGEAGTPYPRLAPAAYADGVGTPAGGPNSRYISNRVFNDLAQNIFSERNVSQWVWTWGQFMDHTFGLAQDSSESRPISFNASDPLEAFRDDFGVIPFKRDAAAPGTGTSRFNPRQQINTVSSYIDGSSVYGDDQRRLDWLRAGPVDGHPSNNSASLLLTPSGYLPRANARGQVAAPHMKVDGQLTGHPQDAAVAGDVRANENMALTAVHTLFAREHNRIVNALPRRMGGEQKFQIARRVVGAEQQYITYTQFLPTVGVNLGPYRGYNPRRNASLGNEFATVAYRAHSMIHGEFDIKADVRRYTASQVNRWRAMGIDVTATSTPFIAQFTVPLNVAFFNPDLVPDLGLGPILTALGDETQYKNDEQIDNALRSVLFQVPGPGAPDPAACFSDPTAQGCFQGVVDLGAIDVERGREHGMPSYNRLRRAFGLPPRSSFAAITGESTDQFSNDPQVDSQNPINDPNILDFVSLLNGDGNPLALGSEEAKHNAIVGTRRSTLAARLKAIYGSADNVDAFVGMVAERHVPGTEFGQLQLSIWANQFRALRDGDRFFYRNDPVLERIRRAYGITYRHTLSELIALNTNVPAGDLPENVFVAEGDT